MDATGNIATQELEHNISEEMEAPTLVADAPYPQFTLAGAAVVVRSQRQQTGALSLHFLSVAVAIKRFLVSTRIRQNPS
jgi:hypothetical protein